MNEIKESDICVQFLLRTALQKVNQVSKSKLSPYGVTPAQYALLRFLWKEDDGQFSSVLGERLQLDSATVTGIIDRLEQNEFIERQFDPKDRRNRLIFLTEKGRSMEHSLCEKMDEMNEEVMSDFDDEEFQQFKEILFDIGIKNKNRGLE
ncbi:MarR family winged helix-turn-helix transcriptional regulator [Halobacillus amylolyticus]|uniref:MarR family transcriptional regulator n=1 Tax=Halobacillus amylolyticus TaxID=2932259 RepID=A0ABY4HGK0_9BACI|nr:MarR family transcriptional regulator [Halobacillus amylolyticus]UOR12560.1 MarR family transcriptional regulator [Halobacillus amylolyticus]